MRTEYSFSVLAVALYNYLFNSINTVCVVLVIDIRNPNSFWKLPGGMVDGNEGLKTAVIRELLQETGIDEISEVYLSGNLDKTTVDNKHVQHCFTLQVLNLYGLHTKPVRDGHELLVTGIFPIKHIYEAIITNSTVDIEQAINYKDIKYCRDTHNSKVFTPHANFIYQSFKLLFDWE